MDEVVAIRNRRSGDGPDSCPLCAIDILPGTSHTLPCCDTAICSECLRTYIHLRIESGEHALPCPSADCQVELSAELVQEFTSEAQRHRLDLLRLNAGPQTTRRSCPHCTHICSVSEQAYEQMKSASNSLKESARASQVVCEACGKPWCYFCYAPVHPARSCKENLEKGSQFNSWLQDWDATNQQQNAFRCPRCRIPIQRDGGCPGMTCSSCSCQWCYNCGKETGRPAHALLGSHGGDKWDVNACDKFLIFGSKKTTRRLRWFKLVQEIIIVSVSAAAILTICLPFLPVLIFVVPPVLFLFYSARKRF